MEVHASSVYSASTKKPGDGVSCNAMECIDSDALARRSKSETVMSNENIELLDCDDGRLRCSIVILCEEGIVGIYGQLKCFVNTNTRKIENGESCP
jgi:hypothetical protein